MFGIGFTELLIILIFGFLIFGPDKLPKVARTAGHAIGKFRELQKEARDAVKFEDFVDPEASDPFENSLEAATKIKDVAVRSAKDLKDDALGVASETKDSLKERKDTLSEKKAEYDERKKEREKKKAEEDSKLDSDGEKDTEETKTSSFVDNNENAEETDVSTEEQKGSEG